MNKTSACRLYETDCPSVQACKDGCYSERKGDLDRITALEQESADLRRQLADWTRLAVTEETERKAKAYPRLVEALKTATNRLWEMENLRAHNVARESEALLRELGEEE